MSSIKPTAITADRYTKEFTITWDDGHASIYPFALLRYACPCAECRGGHENMGTMPNLLFFEQPNEDKPSIRVRNIEAVGTYAITIEWEDGHHYGIYNWRYLRALCPCQECRSQIIT